MIVSQKMVADADMNYQAPTQKMVLDVNYHHLCVASSADVAQPSSSSSTSPSFRDVHRVSDSMSADISRFEPVMSCSDTVNDAAIESASSMFVPNIRSGSYADIGPRDSMDDEHIRIDDLSAEMDSFFKFPVPSAFYAVFDGHGGPEAAAYIKRNAMRLFFEDADLPQTSEINAIFLEELENSHRKAFKLADLALADERSSVSSSCGTTALTALILGRHLLVANAGDCRAVLCRKGVAVAMSQDHKPTYLPERKRVEGLGGYVEDIYLNGYLSVTRALGDWDFKSPLGPASPLIAEPDVQQVALSEDDEFLIIGCDGLWDVVNSQCAVSLVRRALRRHGDPQECARELVMEALRLYSSDNITVIVICLSAQKFDRAVETCPRPRRWRPPSLSEEARNRSRKATEC